MFIQGDFYGCSEVKGQRNKWNSDYIKSCGQLSGVCLTE